MSLLSQKAGKGGCEVARIGLKRACQRKAKTARFTGLVTIHLCAKCDAKFGPTVGKLIMVNGPDSDPCDCNKVGSGA